MTTRKSKKQIAARARRAAYVRKKRNAKGLSVWFGLDELAAIELVGEILDESNAGTVRRLVLEALAARGLVP